MNASDHFNLLAPHYEACRPAYYPLLDDIGKGLKLTKGKHLIDIGCGPGHDLQYFSERFGIVPCGVDASEAMCAHACQRIGNSVFFADAIEYLQADGVFFDAALLKFSLHHFSNVDQLFSCVSRRLLRGGRVAIVTMREEDVHHFCLADFFPSMQMAMMGIARQLPVAVASMERSGIKLLEETDCIIAEERWDDSLLNRIRARYISFLNVVPDDELEAGILRIAEEIRQRTLTGRVFIQGVTLYGSR